MEVTNHERVSRFLLRSDWFSRKNDRVKPDAFMPPSNLNLSVSCTENLSEEIVWSLGSAVVSQRSDEVKLYGRGDLPAAQVRAQKLDIKRDDTPQYHANVIGWPNDGKAALRMKAVELAAASKLVLHEI